MKGSILLLIAGLIIGAFIVYIGLNYQNGIIIGLGSFIFLSSPLALFIKVMSEAGKEKEKKL